MREVPCMNFGLGECNEVLKQLRMFWELKSLGITRLSALRMTIRLDKALIGRSDTAEGTMRQGYLPDNFRIVMKWFNGLLQKLKTAVMLFRRYNDEIEDYLQPVEGRRQLLTNNRGQCEVLPASSCCYWRRQSDNYTKSGLSCLFSHATVYSQVQTSIHTF